MPAKKKSPIVAEPESATKQPPKPKKKAPQKTAIKIEVPKLKRTKQERHQNRLAKIAVRREIKFDLHGLTVSDVANYDNSYVVKHGDIVRATCSSRRHALKRAHAICRKLDRHGRPV